MTNSCKDCPNRHVGCHGECEKYKAYCAELEKERQRRKLLIESTPAMSAAKLANVRRQARRKLRGQRG